MNIKKRECELVSEIDFINEKINKFQFYLNDMKERLRKHGGHASCQQAEKMLQEIKGFE